MNRVEKKAMKKRMRYVKELAILMVGYNGLLNKEYKKQDRLARMIRTRLNRMIKWCKTNLDTLSRNERIRVQRKKNPRKYLEES